MLDIKKGTGFFWDWPVHALCLILSIAAELIGSLKFNFGVVSFTLYPMLYTIIFGMALGAAKVIPRWMQETASPYMMTSILLMGARSISTLGPNITKIFDVSIALFIQQIGHLGTALFSIPFAVFVFGMGRAAVGAGFSISREGSMMVIGNIYGLDSDEGMGVLGGYFTGTLFGNIVCSIAASLIANTHVLSPYALAMACGVGSASMMTASIASVMDAFPEVADTCYTLAYTSNTVSGLTGMYMNLFVALPFANWLYKTCWKIKGGEPKQKETKSTANE